jgi:hypothetical protein
VTTELGPAAGFPKEELEMFKDHPFLAAKDVADSVIYVLGTPPHVQVSIEGKPSAVAEFCSLLQQGAELCSIFTVILLKTHNG